MRRTDERRIPATGCRESGINIGKLVMTGSKSDLFHDDTLMRDLRIRVAYRKKLAYTFHIADQQDIRQRAY